MFIGLNAHSRSAVVHELFKNEKKNGNFCKIR